ncbi:E3 ubiquitin-protein ligase atl23 [Thalictrum thalictroides]|uniref:E3 ubiquitin-protein ligase atl23 n=1 Tax=Thalictrum thalictroides TaxID=46969 RepID=A0A7J6VC19_THATH|nr:E3 ubiquitin-protein ligase atl23 [Thalictrum thalictroides]
MFFVSLIFAFLLLCLGMLTVFTVYIFLLWCTSSSSSTNHNQENGSGQVDVKKPVKNGLSDSELKKLPCSVACREIKEMECVVCLENIEVGQFLRLLPDCHHGFHLECADAWLSKNSACPICRHKLYFPPEPDDDAAEKNISPDNLV